MGGLKALLILLWLNLYLGSRVKFFATTVPGLEAILYDEIKLLQGAENIHLKSSGVEFSGTVKTGLEALMWLRTPLKLMENLVDNVSVNSKEDLYDVCRRINWIDTIPSDGTIKCDCVMGLNNPPSLTHTHFNSLTIKNAIVDQFRDETGSRPSVHLDDPDLSLLMYLHKSKASLYRVWSGDESMHKRGYRNVIHKAMLRETTAAAM